MIDVLNVHNIYKSGYYSSNPFENIPLCGITLLLEVRKKERERENKLVENFWSPVFVCLFVFWLQWQKGVFFFSRVINYSLIYDAIYSYADGFPQM